MSSQESKTAKKVVHWTLLSLKSTKKSKNRLQSDIPAGTGRTPTAIQVEIQKKLSATQTVAMSYLENRYVKESRKKTCLLQQHFPIPSRNSINATRQLRVPYSKGRMTLVVPVRQSTLLSLTLKLPNNYLL